MGLAAAVDCKQSRKESKQLEDHQVSSAGMLDLHAAFINTLELEGGGGLENVRFDGH